MLEQVRLAAVVLERQTDLRAVRRDRVGTRPREEPHEAGELRDAGDQQEEELDDQLRRGSDELADAFPEASQSVEDDQEQDDHEEDDEPPQVVVQHVRRRAHE